MGRGDRRPGCLGSVAATLRHVLARDEVCEAVRLDHYRDRHVGMFVNHLNERIDEFSLVLLQPKLTSSHGRESKLTRVFALPLSAALTADLSSTSLMRPCGAHLITQCTLPGYDT